MLLVLFFAYSAILPAPAWAASPADEACRDWYDQQIPDEQAREDNEAQLGDDVDADGCTGILAAPSSEGPVEEALEEGGVPEDGGQGEDGSEGEEIAQADDPQGGSEEPATGEEVGSGDCAQQFAADAPEEQAREQEEDLRFNADNDGDGCVTDRPADDSTGMDGTPADAPQGEVVPEANSESTGNLTGMVLDFFRGILLWVWDNTFGWALEQMAEAFETDLLSLPTLEGRGDLLGFYTGAVEKLRPAILVGILMLGILMMVRSDYYDLAYAGFQGLPKLMGVAMAMAFLPQFMGELARITAGTTAAFFPSGGDVDGAGQELFKAAVGNMALTNFLNIILLIAAAWVGMLVVIVALLKSILYAILFVAGPFALVASLVPGLGSLAGSWFRGVLACAAIPALWSIELSIGTFAVSSPESIFGEGANALGFVSESAVTAVGAILILWLMYKTPFKVVEWAFNVQLPGRGGLAGLAKTAASLAVALPLKTAVATTVKNAVGRGSVSPAAGASVPNPGGSGSAKDSSHNKGPDKSEGAGSGATAARKVQQARRNGQRDRKAENVSKSTLKYLRQMDRRDEGQERFMQGSRRRSREDTGMSNRPGDRSRN